jgi:hypothetical protein
MNDELINQECNVKFSGSNGKTEDGVICRDNEIVEEEELQRVDEFAVPGNLVFDDVKARIKFWLKTGIGSEYQFRIITEDNVSMTRAEHDYRVCAVPLLVTPLLLILMVFSIGFLLMSPQTFLTVIIGMLTVLMVSYLGALLYCCLKPQEVTFELRFSRDAPITITVGGEGEILRARGDYESLKRTILRADFNQLPKPDAW